MLKKLVRTVFTIIGAVFGYALFALTKFLVSFAGHEELIDFSWLQELCIAALFVIIFGLIFFRLTPTLKKQGSKVANNIESDLQKMSANDLVMGTIGLIAGLIIAFLISQIYNYILRIYTVGTLRNRGDNHIKRKPNLFQKGLPSG